MQRYSENQIRSLYSEFRNHKKYADKLVFFDRQFGIIPFPFPDFDPALGFLFQKEKIEELVDIFKKERNNPGLTEKKFVFGETFIFNIKPANSNSSAYSNYILSSFLSRAPVFDHWIGQYISAFKPIEFFLNEANGYINQTEYFLENEYDKSFRLQCMAVFYKGFYDAFRNRVNLPGKKRKFIELYLYAQGIIYAKFISALKTALKKSRNPVDFNKPAYLDLPGKLDLMKELGIIEFLRTRYSGMDRDSFENMMVQMICLITGEIPEEKESILSCFTSVQNANGVFKFQPPLLSE